MSDVGVIGAGIAGLTAAYYLQKKGCSVQVLEAADRVGGVIQTTHAKGFLVEHGPNSLRSTALLTTLIKELDLESERVPADETASTRYIVRNGEPVPLPMSLRAFLTTSLFSTRAKLRLLAEPLIRSRSDEDPEESVAQFTRRRLGAEILDYAVAPFVGGVFAGDPEHLSAHHAFERLVRLEEEYGSLFWGAVSDRGGDSTSDEEHPSLFSFADGLHTLPAALNDALGPRVHCNAPVRAIDRDGSGWRVTVERETGSTSKHSFDALVCTVPLHQIDEINVQIEGDWSAIEGVWYPPLHVIALGYDDADVHHPLDGFGMLVPPAETDVDILGTLFSSTLFPGRAPNDQVLLTTFVGGGRRPDLARRPSDQIRTEIVERDLARLLGVSGSPTFTHAVHWKHAIPQYTVGYGQVKATLQTLESRNPGLYFAGNYRRGVSVGDAMKSGAEVAERIVAA